MRIALKPIGPIILVALVFFIAIWSFLNMPVEQRPLAVATDKAGNSYHSVCTDFGKQLSLAKFDARGQRLWLQTIKSSDFIDYYRGSMRASILVGDNDIYIYLIDSAGIRLFDMSLNDGTPKWVKGLSGLVRIVHQRLDVDGIIFFAEDNRSFLVRRVISFSGDQVITQNIMSIPAGYSVHLDSAENVVFSKLDQNRRILSLKKVDLQGRQLLTLNVHAVELIGSDQENNLYLAGYDDETLIKLSPAGDRSWTIHLNKPLDQGLEQHFNPDGLVANKDGLYLVGVTNKLNTIENTYVGHRADFFLCRIDRSGKSRWLKTIRGDDYYGLGGVCLDSKGSILLNGQYAFLDVRDSFFAAKYSPDGKTVWNRRDFKPSVGMMMSVFYLLIALYFVHARPKNWLVIFIINIVMFAFYIGLIVFGTLG